jgi:DNA-binding CsgD family transcriptional regulator
MLLGREVECAAIDRVLDDARSGASGALVLLGEPGIGKTALIEYAVERAARMLVVRAQGVQSETEVAFGGLLEVCRPLLRKMDDLPTRQATALRAALALGPAAPPDRLTVGAATLTLLAAAAEDTPLVVAVDDAHWLDAESAEALWFAARRLQAEAVAVLVAARIGQGGRGFEPTGLAEIVLSGLSLEATRVLLGGADVADDTAARFHVLTGGNPLALLELPTRLDGAPRGGLPLEPIHVGERLEAAFAARADALGLRTRESLLVVAASSTDDAAVIAAALEARDLSMKDLAAAEDAGLIRITLASVRFRHPLVRSALYHRSAPSARRAVHAALAAALGDHDPGATAWHRAAAAAGPDEAVAQVLEQTGDENGARGASSAAAAAYEASARLSRTGSGRARRLGLAGRQAWLAGQAVRARRLIDEAAATSGDDAVRADLLHLGGDIEQFTGRPAVAHRMLLEAAELTRQFDTTRAALILGDAADACLHLGAPEYHATVTAVEGLTLPRNGVGEFRRQIVLSQAASYHGSGSFEDHARAATRLLEDGGVELHTARDFVWAGRAHWIIAEYDACSRLGEAAAVRARESAPGVLPEGLRLVAQASHVSGRWNAAYAAASEAVELADALGQKMVQCACSAILAAIAAKRGHATACRAHADETIRLADELEMGVYRLRAERAVALLELGTGRLDDAINALERVRLSLAASGNREFFISPAPDMIEALVRAGRASDAEPILRELEPIASRSPGELAIVDRCRGLLTRNDFDAPFKRATTNHTLWDNPFELARTRLCFGERLRRARRRRDAREQLRAANATFEELAAAPWAARAATELRATGETVRRRDSADDEELTPQELQIAVHVAEGKSNREIGAALFLSPRTVEFHLTRVYRKLNIHSRAELIRRFSAARPIGLPLGGQ